MRARVPTALSSTTIESAATASLSRRDATEAFFSAIPKRSRTELFDIDLPPNADQRAEPHMPGSEEVVVCVSGGASVGPVGEQVSLKAGDSAWFVCDGPHAYSAGARGAKLLNLILLPITAAH